jgi:AcrR family transcriptional regulator
MARKAGEARASGAARGKPGEAQAQSGRAVDDTLQSILDSAEMLFAEHGIEGTSVRSVLATAGANVAAVHYHFGSKDRLVEEVFKRRADRIAADRMAGLRAALADPDPEGKLERILRAFLESGFTGDDTPEAAARFARLRARILSEDSDLARRLQSQSFDGSSNEFMKAIGETLPHLDEAQIGWRFHAMLGIMVYTMANPGRIQALTQGKVDPSDYLSAVDQLLPVVAALFRSEAAPQR